MYKYSLFDLLKKYNIKPNKRLGQNFLINSHLIEEIFKNVYLNGENVVEIGSGLGILTNFLLQKSKSVKAIEYDELLCSILKKEMQLFSNLEIINQDFLKYEFKNKEKVLVFGNIPYYITSRILFKLLENISKIKCAYLLIQDEIAQKLIANHKSSNYGKLSVTIQHFANIKIIKKISSSHFFPEPKVDSSFIMLDFNKSIDYFENIKYLKFIKNIFNQQRKTFVNNFKNHYSDKLSKLLIKLEQLNIPINIRPQELNNKELSTIFKEVVE